MNKSHSFLKILKIKRCQCTLTPFCTTQNKQKKREKFTINILLFPQKQKVFFMRTDFIEINNAA